VFFFANFDQTTIVNLVSNFTCITCFIYYFLMAWTYVVLFCFKGVLNPNFRPLSFELKKKMDFLK